MRRRGFYKMLICNLRIRRFLVIFSRLSVLLFLATSVFLTFIQRFYCRYLRHLLFYSNSIVGLKPACLYTGRSRATSQHLYVDRFVFKSLTNTGFVPGFTRSS